MSQFLDYRGQTMHRAEPDSRHLVTAIACSVSSLAAASLIFVLWLFIRSRGFIIVSVWITIVGCVMFAAGSLALLVHVLTNWAFLKNGPDRKAHWKKIIMVAILVIANPVICALAAYVMSRMTAALYD